MFSDVGSSTTVSGCLAMELEQQAHLKREIDMETNQHMAAVTKTCKNYLPREVQDSGWETTVGGTLAMELQQIHLIYRCN